MAKQKKNYDVLDKSYITNQYKIQAFNKLFAMFKYNNLPETIPQRNLEKILLHGYACIAKVDEKLYAFDGGLGGENPDGSFVIDYIGPRMITSFKIGIIAVVMQLALGYPMGVLMAKHKDGIADRVGSLEPGKDADIVITNGCPFEVSTNVKAVFINGKRVGAHTLFAALES